MESFREKNGGISSNRLIEEQIGTEVSPKDTCIAPAKIGSEEHLKPRIRDLERPLNQEEETIVTVKARMSEEIQGLKPELRARGHVLEAKKEPIQRSNRRRKFRIYLP